MRDRLDSASHLRAEPDVIAGRYRIERRLASGGMGEVFAAFDTSKGARIALKRMLPAARTQRSFVVHFMREYHALSELRHPRIIEVYDYGVDQDVPYYTMELLDGQDLRELSPVPYREACRYLRDVASSLALLHARHLLHRDVSPANVRRTSDGHCKLLDFGAMVPFGIPPNLSGTPPCIPPEALQGAPLDQRSDLYALGALAYHVLTGRHAYAVREIAALPDVWSRRCVNPRRILRDLPEKLDLLVMSMLSVDPMKRPGSAAEVIDRLSAAAELEADDTTAVARSFLTGSQLVARETASEQLRMQMTDTLAGRGSAVLIGGASGLGRSRMLAEAALIGQTSGLTVVRAVARAQRGAASRLIADLVFGLQQAAPVEAQRASAMHAQALHDWTRADPQLAADSGKQRALPLAELTEFFLEFARARPLLITVDDLDRADELSGALVAALAYQTTGSAMSIVASYDSRQPPSQLAPLLGMAATISLQPLDSAQTLRLVESLFGEVPNLERVSDWLFHIADGSPKLTLELSEYLLSRGLVRYIDGTWVLPSAIDEPVPPSAAGALMLRLGPLSAQAKALAEILCVSRGGASAERFLDLARQSSDVVFSGLDELVRAGILESAGDEYVFAQRALRKALAASLDPTRRQQLHALWAERLLAQPPDRDRQLEAGWHLIHTDQELRGAQLLAKIGPALIERRVSMAAAVPAIERALEVFERRGRPLAERLRLRALLVMSSYLIDYRLAERYGDDTLDALYPFTGLAEVERLSRRVGKYLGLALGLSWAALRWCCRRPSARGPNVLAALKDYARSAMGIAGLRALALDGEGVRAMLHRMRAFEGSPHRTLANLHMLTKCIVMHNEGRGAEIEDMVASLFQHLSNPRRLLQMSQQERVDLLVGALLLEGISECYRERSRALQYAERLEQAGTPLSAAAALRVRMTYHSQLGDRASSQRYRRLIDLNAIQNGTLWQVDWIAVPIEGIVAVTWNDVVVLRRSLDSLDRLTLEVPSFAGVRDAIAVCYNFRRGDYATAVRLGEEFMQAYPAFTQLSWAAAYAMTALSYVELEQPQRALEICERARAPITEAHLKYIVSFTTLEAAHATALAALGQRERAEQMFSAMMRKLRASGEHVRACLMYEYRVNMARRLGDRPGLFVALAEMREAALASNNPTAIAFAERIANLRSSENSSPLPPPVEQDPTTLRARPYETAVTAFLQQANEPKLRAKQALQVLGEYAGSGEAYLFWTGASGLQLQASLGVQPPPAALERLLVTLPANDGSQALELSLGQLRYRVFRFGDTGSPTLGLAVLRQLDGARIELPGSLIAEVGRVLSDEPKQSASA